MLSTNIAIPSSAHNMEVLLEVFFQVQANEHVKAWRWNCYRTGNYHYWPEFSNVIIYGSVKHEML